MLISLQEEERESYTGRPFEDGGRDWGYAAASKGMPRTEGHHRELGRGKEGLAQRAGPC